MKLASQMLTEPTIQSVQELYHRNGWTDGLPIVPPTPEAVSECLEWSLMTPEQIIGFEPVREKPITAEKIAINAVMAGCLPMHFPAVATAWSAMLQEQFLLHGATASTGGCAIMVVLNGPVRQEIGAATSFNPLGGGDRATAAIGRAIRLGLINIMDVRPGAIDRSTLGHPGKISYCIAEDEEASPWPSLAAERLGDPYVSAVTAVAAMGPRQLMNEWTTDPAEILDTFVAEIKANMTHYSIWAGNYTIVIPPQLREHFATAGWSKADIRAYVFEHARVERSAWADCGKASIVGDQPDREYRALDDPDQLLVVAAGGPAGGFGAVIPPWLGTRSHAVTVPIGACVDC